MKILVCVKSVPDPESSFQINGSGDGYKEDGLRFQPSEYDLHAMEQAARIRESLADTEVTVLSAGPPRVEEQVRKAMGMGGDHGLVIDDTAAPARDAFQVAALIAEWARPRGFGLILCGVMSEDLQRAQVGPMLAELLGMPCATTVIQMSLDHECRAVRCVRELEGGARHEAELSLPALVTVQSSGSPRYPSLSNVLRVRKMDIPLLPAESLSAAGAPVPRVIARLSETAGSCEFIEGDLETMASQLIQKIRERTPVL